MGVDVKKKKKDKLTAQGFSVLLPGKSYLQRIQILPIRGLITTTRVDPNLSER